MDTEGMNHVVYISGWHSGPNPSPGAGIARSLIEGYKNIQIVAVDYSDRSTGLHEDFISDRVIMPRWKDADLKETINTINSLATPSTTAYISGLDLETLYLVNNGITLTDNVLAPPQAAVMKTLKPASWFAQSLGLSIPKTVQFDSITQATKFAENLGWPVFIKGENYEAKLAKNLLELEDGIDYMLETWGGKVIIQEAIQGMEKSVAFSAYRGKMLDCCTMEKTFQTPEGKTWNGHISRGTIFEDSLKSALMSSNWTGGGEIEMVHQSQTGDLYLIDLNPRFPAWIYGATIAGINLPALLIGSHFNLPAPTLASESAHSEFVRVVRELPAIFGRPSGKRFSSIHLSANKKGHPSGMPELSRLSHRNNKPFSTNSNGLRPIVDPYFARVVADNISSFDRDPISIFMPDRLRSLGSELHYGTESLSKKLGVSILPSYSIKTNPAPEVLSVVQKLGFGAEAISLAEYKTALEYDFDSETAILNGPGKWWSKHPIRMNDLPGPGYINVNSIDDLLHTINNIDEFGWRSTKIGLRIRPFATISRFGLNLSDPSIFSSLVGIMQSNSNKRTFGFHFHLAASSVGHKKWRQEFHATCIAAKTLQDVSGVRFKYVDIGGGFNCSSLDEYATHIGESAAMVTKSLQSVEQLLLEPGKYIVQRSYCIVSRILSIDKTRSGRDVVISAAISDVPDTWTSSHDIWIKKKFEDGWIKLGRGNDRLLGRVCMEDDVITKNIELPPDIHKGDYVVILDVGAYDHSMSYSFGYGVCRDL